MARKPKSKSSDADRAKPAVLFRIFSLEVTWTRLGLASAVLAVLGGLIAFGHLIDIKQVHAKARELPGWIGVALLTFLPLVGFPVSLLHVAAGVRFGIGGGMVAVAASTLVQHVLAWGLVRIAPQTFAKRLKPWRDRLPEGEHVSVTVLCCLLPGLPYSAQLYLLPMIGVPLSVIIWCGVTLHTARAAVSIIGGDLSDELTPMNIAWLTLYYLAGFTACFYLLRRICRRLDFKLPQLAQR